MRTVQHPSSPLPAPPRAPHLQDLDNHELVLGEDLGKAVGLLHKILNRSVALNQTKALLGLRHSGARGQSPGTGGRVIGWG